MGQETGIAWTDHTFNPWWGCQRVGLKVWGPTAERRFFGDKHWAEPVRWNRDAEKACRRARVFCASMADVFEDREDLVAPRQRLADLIEGTPWLDWQLLTKRPQNAHRLWVNARGHGAGSVGLPTWQPNVWIGTTVEDQRRADERIPALLKIPARVRFLSCEPLLEEVDLRIVAELRPIAGWPLEASAGIGIDWVIVGGESGPRSRPFDLGWASDLVEGLQHLGIATFVKQLGDQPVFRGHPFTVRARKGEDPEEWPELLRVRQFPTPRGVRP